MQPPGGRCRIASALFSKIILGSMIGYVFVYKQAFLFIVANGYIRKLPVYSHLQQGRNVSASVPSCDQARQ